MGEVRSHFERIERLLSARHEGAAWSQAMERIAQDQRARDRFLAYATRELKATQEAFKSLARVDGGP